MTMNLFMMRIVGGGDFGQKPGNHFDNVRDRHGTNLELAILSPQPWYIAAPLRLRQEFFASKTLNVRQITNLDAAGRARL
jgi:hypothetical protein